MTRETLFLHDFGWGMLGALWLTRVRLIDDRNLPALHQAFHEAFRVIEEKAEGVDLRFVLILDRIYGTSPDIDQIMIRWLGSFVTKDSPGTIWRLQLDDTLAHQIIERDVPGGKDIWLEAAQTFKNHL